MCLSRCLLLCGVLASTSVGFLLTPSSVRERYRPSPVIRRHERVQLSAGAVGTADETATASREVIPKRTEKKNVLILGHFNAVADEVTWLFSKDRWVKDSEETAYEYNVKAFFHLNIDIRTPELPKALRSQPRADVKFYDFRAAKSMGQIIKGAVEEADIIVFAPEDGTEPEAAFDDDGLPITQVDLRRKTMTLENLLNFQSEADPRAGESTIPFFDGSDYLKKGTERARNAGIDWKELMEEILNPIVRGNSKSKEPPLVVLSLLQPEFYRFDSSVTPLDTALELLRIKSSGGSSFKTLIFRHGRMIGDTLGRKFPAFVSPPLRQPVLDEQYGLQGARMTYRGTARGDFATRRDHFARALLESLHTDVPFDSGTDVTVASVKGKGARVSDAAWKEIVASVAEKAKNDESGETEWEFSEAPSKSSFFAFLKKFGAAAVGGNVKTALMSSPSRFSLFEDANTGSWGIQIFWTITPFTQEGEERPVGSLAVYLDKKKGEKGKETEGEDAGATEATLTFRRFTPDGRPLKGRLAGEQTVIQTLAKLLNEADFEKDSNSVLKDRAAKLASSSRGKSKKLKGRKRKQPRKTPS